MSVLCARLGLLESHAASFSLLGRGKRPVRGRLGNAKQLRMKVWWKRDWEDETVDDAFTAEINAQKQTKKKQQELEARKRTTTHVRGTSWERDGEHRQATWDFPTPDEQNFARRDASQFDPARSQDSGDGHLQPLRPVNADRKNVKYVPWGLNVTPNPEVIATVPGQKVSDVTDEDYYWEAASRDVDADPRLSPWVTETPYGSQQSEHEGAEQDEERDALLDIDYSLQLPQAVGRGDPDLALRCLRAAEARGDIDFIQRIPQDTFTQIMNILEPRRCIGELYNAAEDVSERMFKRLGVESMDRASLEYSWMLQNIAVLRRRSGHQLTKEQYLILLESARDMGVRHLAIRLWNSLHDDGIMPNLAMYNALLTTFIRAGRHNPTASYRERVINFNMIARKEKRQDTGWGNYHVGPSGVRERCMVILDAMLKNGITGDTETYSSMIAAAAKEGEIETVKSILRAIWKIDVDQLMAPDPEELASPRKPERDSPQYPTQDLLYTLAHAFGINNSIPTALRLVDYISREYEVPISHDTWNVLFEWTFVLSSRRSGSNARDDRLTGQLPVESLLNLWNTMTGAPYFVKPTMGMYNRMMKNLYQRGLQSELLGKMLEASALCDASKEDRDIKYDILKDGVEDVRQGREPPVTVTQARRTWEAATLVHAKNKRWMKRWMRFFFRLMARPKYGPIVFQTLPRVLSIWREYAASFITYETPTGLVELQLRSYEEMLRHSIHNTMLFVKIDELKDQARFIVGDDWMRKQPFQTRRLREQQAWESSEPVSVELEGLALGARFHDGDNAGVRADDRADGAVS